VVRPVPLTPTGPAGQNGRMLKRAKLVLVIAALIFLVAYHVMSEAGAPKWARLSAAYACLVAVVLATVADIGWRIASRRSGSADHPASLRQFLVPMILLVLPLGLVALIIIVAIMANRGH
jgi:lysylphosphatidylglycerol synthetase-like protein (DUF2156 family)